MTKKNKEELLYTQKVQKSEDKLLSSTKKELLLLYSKIVKKLEKKLKTKNKNNFSEKDLKIIQKELNNEFKSIIKEIENEIVNAVNEIIDIAIRENLKYFEEIDKRNDINTVDILKDKYSDISKKVIAGVVAGKIYSDNLSLIKRIMRDFKENKNSINVIINTGIKNKENANTIINQLKDYINPNKVNTIKYHGAKSTIEYNAIKLSNTSIHHAHHQAIIEMARANPFVEYIRWDSSHHSRMCQLCASRDGKIYAIDDVPTDHPNGKCSISMLIPSDKDIKSIYNTLK